MEETTEDADLKIYAGSNSWNVTWRKSPTAILGGGNSKIFHFHPEFWGDDPI